MRVVVFGIVAGDWFANSKPELSDGKGVGDRTPVSIGEETVGKGDGAGDPLSMISGGKVD